MKKIMLLTILLSLMLCPLPASAQDSGPSRVDRLLLRDSMLVLWSMGLKESGPKSQDALCRDALFFVILSEGASACGVERAKQPEFFRGIAENYQGFVPKHKVEEVARTIFAQEVSRHIAPEGSAFNGKGYFLDFSALSDKTGYLCHLMPMIKCPTLLVWGENDTATPLADALKMERLIPDAGLVTFSGAGHYSFLDNPYQFAAVIRSFLSEEMKHS